MYWGRKRIIVRDIMLLLPVSLSAGWRKNHVSSSLRGLFYPLPIGGIGLVVADDVEVPVADDLAWTDGRTVGFGQQYADFVGVKAEVLVEQRYLPLDIVLYALKTVGMCQFRIWFVSCGCLPCCPDAVVRHRAFLSCQICAAIVVGSYRINFFPGIIEQILVRRSPVRADDGLSVARAVGPFVVFKVVALLRDTFVPSVEVIHKGLEGDLSVES